MSDRRIAPLVAAGCQAPIRSRRPQLFDRAMQDGHTPVENREDTGVFAPFRHEVFLPRVRMPCAINRG